MAIVFSCFIKAIRKIFMVIENLIENGSENCGKKRLGFIREGFLHL